MKDELDLEANNPPAKPSKLEDFKLFYEAIPAPDYITSATEKPSKPRNLPSKRVARRRK